VVRASLDRAPQAQDEIRFRVQGVASPGMTHPSHRACRNNDDRQPQPRRKAGAQKGTRMGTDHRPVILIANLGLAHFL
jgi:hypothetical protein